MKKLTEISEQIKENITQFLENVESTESVLDEMVKDMKARLGEAKDLVAGAIAEEQRLKRVYREAVEAADTWDEKADTALRVGDISLVKEMRHRRQQCLERAADYKRQIAVQQDVVASLKTTLHEFYQQFQNAVKRVETLSYRQKQAETRAKFYEVLAVSEDAIAAIFARAEGKLKATEEKADVCGNRSRPDATKMENGTDNLNLDEALAKLKNDVFEDRGK